VPVPRSRGWVGALGKNAGMTTRATQIRMAIAGNLGRARRVRELSLRGLAERSGVSKALLSQVERGVANPTVDVLSAIAAALEIELDDLIRTPLYEPVVRRCAGPDEGAQSAVSTLFSSPDRRRFQVYEAVIPAGQFRDNGPHGRGSEEFAYVLSGEVSLEILSWDVRLFPGDTVRFSAEADHIYRADATAARVLTVVSMPSD